MKGRLNRLWAFLNRWRELHVLNSEWNYLVDDHEGNYWIDEDNYWIGEGNYWIGEGITD